MSKTLLVADDSATMRRVVEMTFAGEDVQVVSAPNGETALSRAREVRPDVILADVQMGSMTGYDLCRAIKSDAGLRTIAVIVMASQHTPYDEALGREVGADDHCVKPFDTQALIDKVRNASSRAATVRTPAPPAAVHAPPAAAPQAPPPPVSRPAPPPAGPATIKTPAVPPPPSAPPSVRPPPSMAPPSSMMSASAPPAPVAHAIPMPAPEPPAPSPPPSVLDAADSAMSQALSKAQGLGLTPEQAAAVTRLAREVVERVVWEVVPDLAETIIREEIRRLTR